jgi:hypothetical protein
MHTRTLAGCCPPVRPLLEALLLQFRNWCDPAVFSLSLGVGTYLCRWRSGSTTDWPPSPHSPTSGSWSPLPTCAASSRRTTAAPPLRRRRRTCRRNRNRSRCLNSTKEAHLVVERSSKALLCWCLLLPQLGPVAVVAAVAALGLQRQQVLPRLLRQILVRGPHTFIPLSNRRNNNNSRCYGRSNSSGYSSSNISSNSNNNKLIFFLRASPFHLLRGGPPM